MFIFIHIYNIGDCIGLLKRAMLLVMKDLYNKRRMHVGDLTNVGHTFFFLLRKSYMLPHKIHVFNNESC